MRILLVEYEIAISINTGMILEDEGFFVDCAYNGNAGIEHAKSVPPDLIITDYMMPQMDGLAIIAALRSMGWIGRLSLQHPFSKPACPLATSARTTAIWPSPTGKGISWTSFAHSRPPGTGMLSFS